jgi:hypothetical protein
MLRNPPNILRALGILFGWYTVQFIVGMLIYGLLQDVPNSLWINLLINVFATVFIVGVVLKHTGLSVSGLLDDSNNRFVSTASLLFPPIFLTTFASMWWFADLQTVVIQLLPDDQATMIYLTDLLSGGFVAFVGVCLIAPLVEEILFRGIVLRGLLHHYSPGVAITLSACLFAIFHFNLYQLLVAFVMGIFFGWIYLKSRSLWPCIFGHACYNGAAYFMFDADRQFSLNDFDTNLISFGLSMLGVYVLYILFRSQPNN